MKKEARKPPFLILCNRNAYFTTNFCVAEPALMK